jgi:hypothetical protein
VPGPGIERFGVHFVALPRHADMLLVTGPVSRHMQAALKRTYEATPEPKLVIAVGECGANGGEFGVSYASCGAVVNVVPVDAAIRGCPPTRSISCGGYWRRSAGALRGRREGSFQDGIEPRRAVRVRALGLDLRTVFEVQRRDAGHRAHR